MRFEIILICTLIKIIKKKKLDLTKRNIMLSLRRKKKKYALKAKTIFFVKLLT